MSWLPRNNVVVPIDFSDESFDAAQLAREFAGPSGQIHLVHVLPDLKPTEPGVIWHVVDDEDRKRHAGEALQKRIQEMRIEGAAIHVVFGDPAREIVRFAEKIGAELILLPSRGRGGALRVLLGSVSERVLHLAHCPVLVLRN